MRAQRDIRCHGRQGQQFESYPPVKLSDLSQQRQQKVQNAQGPPQPGSCSAVICDPQGKWVPLLWERAVPSTASQSEPRMEVQDTVAQQLDTSVQNDG